MKQPWGHPELFSRETGTLEVHVEVESVSEMCLGRETSCDPSLPLGWCDLRKNAASYQEQTASKKGSFSGKGNSKENDISSVKVMYSDGGR